jgi:SAM-dependent methyltransferase
MELDKDIPGALLERGPFDFILCTEVLEHVVGWERAFENFARLLSRGGNLLITCPHVYVLHEQPYDFWRPTIHALRFFSGKYGFKVVRVEQLGDSWDVLGTLLGASYDKLRPLHGGLLDAYSARLLNKILKVVYRGLTQRWFQRRYSLTNEDLPVYLSNLALLQKE